MAASTSSAPASTAQERRPGRAAKRWLPPLRLRVSPAVALVATAVLGAFAIVKARRPAYYTVEEGDTLCTIGECFARPYEDVYRMNRAVVEDADIIYPGDRCAAAADATHAYDYE